MTEKSPKRLSYQSLISFLNGTQAQADGFNGFGALKELLLPVEEKQLWGQGDLSFEKEVAEVHRLLLQRYGPAYKSVLDGVKNSTLTSFFTPHEIIRPIVAAVRKHYPTETILEPAAGTGNFLPLLREAFPAATITAIEKDRVTFDMLQAVHGNNVECICSPLENFRNRKYGLVISNIPFGSVQVYDEQIFREAVAVKIKATTRIHNYFFVKGLDNCEQGGLVAFITSSGVMDSPSNKEVREYLMKQSDLVSALRLPNNVFAQAGTSPVTDIIVLRKRVGKKGLSAEEQLFVETQKVQVANQGFELNTYYEKFPERVFGQLAIGGQYGRDALDVVPREGVSLKTLGDQISKLLEEDLGKGLWDKASLISMEDSSAKDRGSSVKSVPSGYPDRDLLKEGNLVVLGNAVGYAFHNEGDWGIRIEPAIKDSARASLLVSLRNNLNKLIAAELSNDLAMNALRSELTVAYDQFVFQYGNLYASHNKKLLLFDVEGFKVLSLERSGERGYEKSDIFFHQVNNVQKAAPNLANLQDSILLSLNSRNCIDLGFLESVMQRPQLDIAREAVSRGFAFVEFDASGRWRVVPRDEFLSGNIVSKMELLQQYAATGPEFLGKEDLQRQLQLLDEVRPPLLPRELIEINMGVRWVPLDVYEQFATELFKAQTEIKFLKSVGQYLVSIKEKSNENDIAYAALTANGPIKGERLLEYALHDTVPKLSVLVESGPPAVYAPDIDGMKNAELKIKEIRKNFETFTTKNKQVADRLVDLYNHDINNFIRRKYDGSHLTFEGLEYYSPKKYQPDAVWKIVQEDGGLIDHWVGAGKSLTISMATMKMRRLGVANKPLILCLKANVDQVAKEFQRSFPEARILAPSEKDYTRENRKTIFSAIATNDWDAVILTHDNFLRIPQNPKIVSQILGEELAALDADIKLVSSSGGLSKRALKGLERRKEAMVVRIRKHEASIKRDDHVMNFDTMGFDHLFVDESQEFKNLAFTTRHQNVSGLGSPEGSDKARNLQYAIRTIQGKKGGDRGVTFASGTPISNSLVEMYLLKKYLRPERLEQAGILSFDAWALMFAKKSSTYEFTITNEVKLKERYREFVNLPELAMWYGDMAHVVTPADIGGDKPKLEHVMVNIDPTISQRAYIDKLIEFTRTKDATVLGLPPLTKEEESAFMLLATNLAKKMSLDMRLIDASYPYEPSGKIGTLCNVVRDEYENSSSFNGTQLIFCDLGTPAGKGFGVYDEIKRRLIEKGVPGDEIFFIHDFDTKEKKRKLTKMVNQGEKRVGIGSTKKMGTGINLQERMVALHHLDLPWRPSDMDQRDGRGARHGAKMAKEPRGNVMKSYVYAVNRTLDAYQFNILSNKQKFIQQVKSTVKERRFDEGAIDQEGGMNFAEYVAMLSGNADLLEKVRLEKKLSDLTRGYDAFIAQANDAKFWVTRLEKENRETEKSLSALRKDFKRLEHLDLENQGIVIGGKKYHDRKVVGEELLAMFNELQKRPFKETIMATMGEFKLMYDWNSVIGAQKFRVVVESPEGLKYNYAEGQLNENPALAGRFMIDALKRIPKVIEAQEQRIKDALDKIKTYQRSLSEQYPDALELEQVKKKIEEVAKNIEVKANQRTDLPAKKKSGESRVEIDI